MTLRETQGKVPRISVVIPAYNEEKRLPSCLSSLKKQTFKDFEIIVVDNNSTDKTAGIARTFSARVVKEPIQGMTPARERGYKEAKGEIIARTDADATVPPDWLTQIHQTFHNNPKLIAITGSFTFPGESKIISWLLKLYVDIGYYKLTKLLTGHFPLSGPNHALRKSVWQKIKAHKDDRLIHEDMDLSCHLAEIGEIDYRPEIKATFTLRRWRKNFWVTLYDYGLRYFRTIFLHHPCLSRHKKLQRK